MNPVRVVFLMLVIASSFMAGLAAEYNRMKERVIEHGCGQYSSLTGEFEWVKRN